MVFPLVRALSATLLDLVSGHQGPDETVILCHPSALGPPGAASQNDADG